MASNNNLLEFLTKNFVENILKDYFKDSSIKVLNIETVPATGKGDGYCSIMTRMRINYTVAEETVVNQINLIIKSNYENDSIMFKTLQKYDVFKTEMEMYANVFPQLQQMLNEIGDDDQMCAKALHVDRDRNVIILEDLSVREFVMPNRLEGMNEMQIKTCLRKLAKMHATAAALNERQRGVLEKFSHGIFNRHVNCYGVFFENTITVCAKFAETCPELGSYYREKLLKLVPFVVEYATRCNDSHPNHFFTLNHGDMWTNNCMVQLLDEKASKSQQVGDVLLIDFQYCNWTSPAVDLHYLFNTSLQDDLLFNSQPRLIQYYHSVLSETLKKLKYNKHIPTLHQLNVQLLERGFYAVTSCLTNLPLMTNDKTEDADFDCFITSSEKSRRFHNVLYSNERVHRVLKIMLPRFDQMGLLDVQEK